MLTIVWLTGLILALEEGKEDNLRSRKKDLKKYDCYRLSRT